MASSTNRVVFLSSVHEREGIRNENITRIDIREKGGVKNVR